MNLQPALLSLILVTGIAAGSTPAKTQLEIVLREGDCVVHSTGGVQLEFEATSVTRREDTATRITAPAVIRVSANSSYTLTLKGSPSLEVVLRASSGVRAVRVSGPTIRLEGDAKHLSIAEAGIIKVLE